MRLQNLAYSQHEGEPNAWRFHDLRLGDVNLLVGKNATGKSRVLNVINGLARRVAGVTKNNPITGTYDALFDDEGTAIRYQLEFRDRAVHREELTLDGTPLLTRGAGGEGMIHTNELGKLIRFQTSPNELAAVARRDKIQHDFFEPLYAWGSSTFHYAFGTPLGRDVLALANKDARDDFDPKDPKQVIQIYRMGVTELGESFNEAIVRDMAAIGYPLDEIGVQPITSLTVTSPFPGEVLNIFVKESGLPGHTEQAEMSQGMFRALSVVIQLNYAAMALSPVCVLIDDIGEGLDFERSCALIDILKGRAGPELQLILSTNDRFVMNNIPLENWTILTHHENDCVIRNYENSREMFEEFRFTGLSNFDLLTTEFYSAGEKEVE